MIRDREELSEQLREPRELRRMAASYGDDISRTTTRCNDFMEKVRRVAAHRDAVHTRSVLRSTSNVVYGKHTRPARCFHLDADVPDRTTLLDAMAHPGKYPQLTIRVPGPAVDFVRLTPEQQRAGSTGPSTDRVTSTPSPADGVGPLLGHRHRNRRPGTRFVVFTSECQFARRGIPTTWPT